MKLSQNESQLLEIAGKLLQCESDSARAAPRPSKTSYTFINLRIFTYFTVFQCFYFQFVMYSETTLKIIVVLSYNLILIIQLSPENDKLDKCRLR